MQFAVSATARGPYSLKVTVPPAGVPSGLFAVLPIVAVSVVAVPTGEELVGVWLVTIVGVFGLTTTDSFESPQAPEADKVFGASPV